MLQYHTFNFIAYCILISILIIISHLQLSSPWCFPTTSCMHSHILLVVFLLAWTRLYLSIHMNESMSKPSSQPAHISHPIPQPTHLNPADGGIGFLRHVRVSKKDYSVTALKTMIWTIISKLVFTNDLIRDYISENYIFGYDTVYNFNL
jgi:hypothetical protein